jgi:hypothetical protein
MNVVETLTALCEEICDNYCRFPELYLNEHKDPDEATDLCKEKCENCPINKII